MKSSGWSSLFLGTILATSAIGTAFAEGPETTAPLVAAASAAIPRGNADMIVDPVAVIDAARAADTIADDQVDRILTGSIFPVTGGNRLGGLTEVRPSGTVGLVAPKTAPEPTKAAATAPETAKAVAAPVEAAKPVAATPEPTKIEPTKIEATKPEPAEAEPAKTEVPKTEAAKTEATPAVAAEPIAATAPAPVTPAVATPAPVEATPAVATPAAAPTTVPGEATATPAPVEASATPVPATPAAAEPVATPAPQAAVVDTKPATELSTATVPDAQPAGAQAPTQTASVNVETAAPSPAKPDASAAPVAAVAPPAAAPTEAAPSQTPAPIATAPAPAPVATTVAATSEPAVTATTPAEPAAAGVSAPATPAATDAAIAATLAAEQAASALKTALEDLQPLAGKAEERAERADLLAFYADRAFLPLFVDGRGTTDRTRAAAAAFAQADRDGLDPQDYALPAIEAGLLPEARAKDEITVARTVVRFARHLQSGRFDPGRVSDLVTAKPPKTETREVLDRVAGSTDVAEVLESYAPPHEGYRRLKAALAELRGAAEEKPMVMVPAGPLLKPGQKDARVALLRERLGVTDVVSDADVYDPSLADAVKAFQRERGIDASGRVGRVTLSALNEEKTGTKARIADLIANMERWRWLPRDLGELYVIVNVADFHLDVMKDGQSIHRARVIVGRPSNQTPIFSEMMQYVVVNPYWNVPYSIVKKEMIGKAQSSAGTALSRGNYEVEIGRQRVDPTTVDWSTVSASNVTIRQRPGSGNALGNIKFMFPNQHSVYIHDTSSRGLFSRDYRALSHGCVRVNEPFSFADAVLSEEPTAVDGARLKKMLGGSEKYVHLKHFVPVHITYFTAFVDDQGQLQTRRDIYGHDARVKRLLDL